jgi:DNA replication licensing factor MCM6
MESGDASSVITDEAGKIVQERFMTFLQAFTLQIAPSANANNANNVDEYDQNTENELTTQQRHTFDYIAQIASMIQNNKTTLFVNFMHVQDSDIELAEAIEIEYFRFEPFLRAAVNEIIKADNPYHVDDANGLGSGSRNGNSRHIFVSFYRMPRVERIRAMRTDRVGRLMSISGTVTRSSEVRPELMYATFQCIKCGRLHADVEQQFVITEPPRCIADKCGSHSFDLIMPDSSFVDWQRLRVQENADEIPAGMYLPRCDVYLRLLSVCVCLIVSSIFS